MHATDTVIVVCGGDPVDAAVAGDLPADAPVVAADRGLDHAHRLGWVPRTVVGDLDSVSDAALARAEREGTRLERHRPDKDQTDLELALGVAASWSPRRVVVVGGHGGRLDHLLGNVLALGTPVLEGIETDAWLGDATVHVVRDRRVLVGRTGELVTLLPVGGPAIGVRTEGLRYPLAGETLTAGSSRGVSNELVEGTATVSLTGGILLVVRPHGASARRSPPEDRR